MSDLIYHLLLETVHCLVDSVYYHVMTIIQGVFFNWLRPKSESEPIQQKDVKF